MGIKDYEVLIDSILSHWELSGSEVKKIDIGYINDNWRVKNGNDKYILRKVDKANEKALSFELRYITNLRNGGFKYKVPMPLETKDGKYYFKCNGSLFWLYRFIEGDHKYKFVEKDIAKVAKLVGSYHNILINNRNFYRCKGKPTDSFTVFEAKNALVKMVSSIKKRRKISNRERSFIRTANALLPIADELADNWNSSLDFYYLHNDIKETNLLWEKGRITGLIDFDFVRYSNILIKDIAVSLQHFCDNKKKGYLFDMKKVILFLRTYSKVRTLAIAEKKMIPTMLITYCIADFEFLFRLMKNSPDRGITMQRVNTLAKMALYIYKNNGSITKEIMSL